MLNVIGSADGSLPKTLASVQRALTMPSASIHWYGKSPPKAKRKMGHINVTATSSAGALAMLSTLQGLADQTQAAPLVGIIMGSDSDLPTMRAAAEILEHFKVPFELTIVSAHRTPKRMFEYAQAASGRGLQCIIAGAGGAAHLPGMVAALTPLPVIGVPVKSSALSGNDSLLSIVQMPRGVPVATVAIGNAANAGVGSAGPLRARKRSMHEGGIRTFGLVRWPGKIPAGRVEESAVTGGVDFLPTIAALAGVKVPANLAADGEDKSAHWLGGPAAPRTRPLYWEWISGVQGADDGYLPPPLCVRDGDWKLFVRHDGQGAQLFDIPKDSAEKHDVAAAHPEVVKELTAKVLAWAKTLPASPARDKFVANGQSKGTAKPAPAKAKKTLDRPKIFVSWDKDNDGFLSKEEFIPHIADKADAPARFVRFDTDKDGRLSKEEFVKASN
jgi:phosphoribosylaminoimidazole carboxylase PurE protein